MPKFKIPVVRTGYGFRDIEVEAQTQEEANEKALDEAGNYEFSERESDYVLPDAAEKFTGEGLSNAISELRSKIERTLERLVDSAKYRYVEENGGTEGTPEGFIELSGSIVHVMHDSDGNLNEVIVGIHTDMKKCQTDCQGEVTDNVWLQHVSNECLVAIIKELEEMIENPEMIKIQTGDEFGYEFENEDDLFEKAEYQQISFTEDSLEGTDTDRFDIYNDQGKQIFGGHM